MLREVNRPTPTLPAAAMVTYAVVTPTESHWRRASCEEVDCPNWRHGWETTIDEATVLGGQQAYYIRRQSGRRFTEDRRGALVTFTFEPGQSCFARDQHAVPLERDPIFLVRGGDWRGNPRHTPTKVHTRAVDWVDDMQTSLDRTRRRVEGG